MRYRKLDFSKNIGLLTLTVVSLLAMSIVANTAHAQTAGDVMTKMNADQRIGYIDGVVEGLAYGRWLRDKPDQSGMNCIYRWYFQKPVEPQWNRITAWLARHPDKPVGALIYVLLKQECGE